MGIYLDTNTKRKLEELNRKIEEVLKDSIEDVDLVSLFNVKSFDVDKLRDEQACE